MALMVTKLFAPSFRWTKKPARELQKFLQAQLNINTFGNPIDSRRLSTHSLHKSDTVKFIEENTEVTRNHLTPEIKLHLITKSCPLWNAKEDECPVIDPFWAFYWPGGQALTR